MIENSESLQNTVALFGRLLQALKPPPRLTISEWAEQYRVVSSEEAAAPGPWHNEVVPHTVGIMDAISDPAVREVVLMTAAQMAKSNILLNVIGYHIHLNPCPIMIVQPTIELGESFSGRRITSMFRDTPCLRYLVPDEKSRTPGNTLREKVFPGGYLTVAGANSAASLKGRPIRVVLFDEVDEAPENLVGQGDPVKLAQIRSTGFPNKKLVLASTPTVKGHSRIETAFENSTRERWSHCCPNCGAWSAFSWRRMQFDTVSMTCPHCEATHTRREWMRDGGKWIAENPESRIRGFHITAMDAPTLTWEELIDEWIDANARAANGDTSALITFINTRLAETWEERGEKIDESSLMTRREEYYADVPDGVCVITIAADTQDNRLAVDIVGWGAGKESWRLGYTELWGDPRVTGSPVWAQLDEIIQRRYCYANGVRAPVVCTVIDSGGHATDQVCTYAKARQGWNVWAIKGIQGWGKLLVAGTHKSKTASATVFNLAVNTGKDEIIALLRVAKPGAGYCHFPRGGQADYTGAYESVRGYDEQYFAGLTAESKVAVRTKSGFHKYEWQKKSGQANEPFDLAVYNLAALNISKVNLDRIAAKAPWMSVKPSGAFTIEITSDKKRVPVKPQAALNKQNNNAFTAV